MKPKVVSFCQKVSVIFRKIRGPKDYSDVLYIETDEYIAIVQRPDRFANFLFEESMMFNSCVKNRDVKGAIEWMQEIIIKYLQNPEIIPYPKIKTFLEGNIRRIPVDTRCTLYDMKSLNIFCQKRHWYIWHK